MIQEFIESHYPRRTISFQRKINSLIRHPDCSLLRYGSDQRSLTNLSSAQSLILFSISCAIGSAIYRLRFIRTPLQAATRCLTKIEFSLHWNSDSRLLAVAVRPNHKPKPDAYPRAIDLRQRRCQMQYGSLNRTLRNSPVLQQSQTLLLISQEQRFQLTRTVGREILRTRCFACLRRAQTENFRGFS